MIHVEDRAAHCQMARGIIMYYYVPPYITVICPPGIVTLLVFVEEAG